MSVRASLTVSILGSVLVLAGAPPRVSADPAAIDALHGARATASSRRTCATSAPTAEESARLRAMLERGFAEPLAGGTIQVAFHVIHDGAEGDVSDERIAEQMRRLNHDFLGTGYSFSLASVDRADSPRWFRLLSGTGEERHMKQALAVDPARRLNVYTCAPHDYLGRAELAWSLSENDPRHGVVVHHGTLPGGDLEANDGGRTLTHEVGHYLGLDQCSAEFTQEQDARMRAIVRLHRPGLIDAALDFAPEEPLPAVPAVPRVLSFRGAWPNPFRDETVLRYSLPASARVQLRVYDVAGHQVANVVDAMMPAGDHSAPFRARGLPAGLYFAWLKVDRATFTRSLVHVP